MTRPDQPVVLTPDQVREWLGGPRFGRYLTAAAGDPGRALALYEWNSHLAAAAARDVGHFEVALRNAYDKQLSARFPSWAADPSSGLFGLESDPSLRRTALLYLLYRRQRRRLGQLDGRPTTRPCSDVVAAPSAVSSTCLAIFVQLETTPPRHTARGLRVAGISRTVRIPNRRGHIAALSTSGWFA